MNPGSNSGTNTSLTARSAAEAIAKLPGLFSDIDNEPEDTETVEEQPELETDEVESPDTETDDQQPIDDDLEEPDDREEEPEQPSKPKLHKVKVADEELEVPEDELIKGYSRTKDYTQKTQKLADERKAFEGEATQLRERLATELDQLTAALKSFAPEEPDWDKLRKENPAAFPQAFAEYQLFKDELSTVEKKRQEAIDAVKADRLKAHNEYLQSEHEKLVSAIPEWKDKAAGKKGIGEVFDYAKGLGYSDADLDVVADHRVLLVLRKAMQFDNAEKAKKTAREKVEKVTVAAPGVKPSVNKLATDLTRAKQRLAKTHGVRDAASVIAQLIDD